mmetsp:Transcript_8252/g.21910  ORF Transcript_8252/g.21910 Transcript_8252/m.21910 type:complete len:412 (-) Transcript_8252:56-1291(-)
MTDSRPKRGTARVPTSSSEDSAKLKPEKAQGELHVNLTKSRKGDPSGSSPHPTVSQGRSPALQKGGVHAGATDMFVQESPGVRGFPSQSAVPPKPMPMDIMNAYAQGVFTPHPMHYPVFGLDPSRQQSWDGQTAPLPSPPVVPATSSPQKPLDAVNGSKGESAGTSSIPASVLNSYLARASAQQGAGGTQQKVESGVNLFPGNGYAPAEHALKLMRQAEIVNALGFGRWPGYPGAPYPGAPWPLPSIAALSARQQAPPVVRKPDEGGAKVSYAGPQGKNGAGKDLTGRQSQTASRLPPESVRRLEEWALQHTAELEGGLGMKEVKRGLLKKLASELDLKHTQVKEWFRRWRSRKLKDQLRKQGLEPPKRMRMTRTKLHEFVEKDSPSAPVENEEETTGDTNPKKDVAPSQP